MQEVSHCKIPNSPFWSTFVQFLFIDTDIKKYLFAFLMSVLTLCAQFPLSFHSIPPLFRRYDCIKPVCIHAFPTCDSSISWLHVKFPFPVDISPPVGETHLFLPFNFPPELLLIPLLYFSKPPVSQPIRYHCDICCAPRWWCVYADVTPWQRVVVECWISLQGITHRPRGNLLPPTKTEGEGEEILVVAPGSKNYVWRDRGSLWVCVGGKLWIFQNRNAE